VHPRRSSTGACTACLGAFHWATVPASFTGLDWRQVGRYSWQHAPRAKQKPGEWTMSRTLASLCLAGLAVLAATGCGTMMFSERQNEPHSD
jgi:hypothetical protein